MHRAGAIIAATVACVCAATAHADYGDARFAGLSPGQANVALLDDPGQFGRTTALSGAPLTVTVQYRRARGERAQSGRSWVTAGPAGRHCGATPARDGGRRLLTAAEMNALNPPFMTTAANAKPVTMPVGVTRVCSWVQVAGGPLRGPYVDDRRFVRGLFAVGAYEWYSASGAHFLNVEAASSDPMRQTQASESHGGTGCTTETRTQDATAYAGYYYFSDAISAGLPQDTSCGQVDFTYAVTSGALAGASDTYGRNIYARGANWDVLHQYGDCAPPSHEFGPPDPRQGLAWLARFGCRPGRIIEVPEYGHEGKPSTFRIWDVVADGAPFEMMPAGTVIDVLVDARPGQKLPGAPAPAPPAQAEPKPKHGDGYGGPPAAEDRPGCTHEVKAGPVDALAGCWVARGERSVSAGRVRLNGIDLTPARPGVTVAVDRRTFAVTSDGPVELRIGTLSLLRDRLEWTRPDAVFEIEGKAKDFSTTGQRVFGLPVDGSVALQLTGGKTQLTVTVKVPDEKPLQALKRLAGWSGELRAAATNDAGLVLDGAKISFPGLQFGFVEVQDAELAVSRTDTGAYHFDGGATVYPFRVSRIGIAGKVGFGPGDGYAKLDLAVENLNRLLVDGFFLQKIGLGLQINPFEVSGSLGATFGPQFRLDGKLVSAARIDGGLSYDGDKLEATGALELAEARSGDAKVTVGGDALVAAEGTVKLEVAGYGFEGKLDGWFDGLRAFNVEGSAALKLPGPDGKGDAVLSSRGAGACRHGFGPDFGFGYEWGRGVKGISFLATGCNLGRWRAEKQARAAQAGGATTLHVRPGLRQLAVRVQGAGGPPAVAFVAPGGRRIEGTELLDATTLLAQDPDTSATYLLVDRPAPGPWRIEPPASGPAIAAVSTSVPLPRLRIHTAVVGRGGRRVLRYRVAGLAGRRVTFVDAAGAARRTLGRARGRSGRLGFRPVPGPRGHRILAIVEQGPIPAGPARTVARFRAGSARPARPRSVRVRHNGTSAVIRWKAAKGVRTELVARLSDGQRILRIVPPGRGAVRLALVPRGVRGTVTLVARDGNGVASRAARARLRARH